MDYANALNNLHSLLYAVRELEARVLNVNEWTCRCAFSSKMDIALLREMYLKG